MKNFNSKFMEEKLKKNWTLDDFLQYFKMAEEQFIFLLKKEFSASAFKHYINKMKQNKKLQNRRKHETSDEKATTSAHSVTASFEEPSQDFEDSNSTQDAVSLLPTDTLEMLLLEKERLSGEIRKDETKRQSLYSRKTEINKKLNQKKEELKKLQATISYIGNEVDLLVQELVEISDTTITVNSEISSKQELLKTTKCKIEALRKVTIFIYENGEIEASSQSENYNFEIPSKYLNTLAMITSKHDDLIGDLTYKQIQQLVKLICLVKSFERTQVPYIIIFESDLVEKVYTELTNLNLV